MARSVSPCNVGHWIRHATPPQRKRTRPSVGQLGFSGALRCLPDAPHRAAQRACPKSRVAPIKRFRMVETCSETMSALPQQAKPAPRGRAGRRSWCKRKDQSILRASQLIPGGRASPRFDQQTRVLTGMVNERFSYLLQEACAAGPNGAMLLVQDCSKGAGA